MNEFEEICKHSEGWQAFLKFKSALIEQDPNYETMPENILLYIYTQGKVNDYTRWQDICPTLDAQLIGAVFKVADRQLQQRDKYFAGLLDIQTNLNYD